MSLKDVPRPLSDAELRDFAEKLRRVRDKGELAPKIAAMTSGVIVIVTELLALREWKASVEKLLGTWEHEADVESATGRRGAGDSEGHD